MLQGDEFKRTTKTKPKTRSWKSWRSTTHDANALEMTCGGLPFSSGVRVFSHRATRSCRPVVGVCIKVSSIKLEELPKGEKMVLFLRLRVPDAWSWWSSRADIWSWRRVQKSKGSDWAETGSQSLCIYLRPSAGCGRPSNLPWCVSRGNGLGWTEKRYSITQTEYIRFGTMRNSIAEIYSGIE